MLDDVQRQQVPFATAKALTLTAKEVEKSAYNEMRSRFDRPTPFVMRGLRTKPARKNSLTAMVYVKDYQISGHNSFSSAYQSGLANILGHEFSGGPRQRKMIEMRFQQKGLITSSEYLVPGAGAKIDSYGNMSRGQTQQILSQIGMTQSGYSNLPSNSSRSKRNQQKAGQIFWSPGNVRGHNGFLPKGVWLRTRGGLSLKPLLIVVRQPSYKQRIDLQQLSRQVIARDFNGIFAKCIDDAVRTAR